MLNETLALGTTWPSKVLFNPRKVRAFGMRAGRNICLTRNEKSLNVSRFENCKMLQVFKHEWIASFFIQTNFINCTSCHVLLMAGLTRGGAPRQKLAVGPF